MNSFHPNGLGPSNPSRQSMVSPSPDYMETYDPPIGPSPNHFMPIISAHILTALLSYVCFHFES